MADLRARGFHLSIKITWTPVGRNGEYFVREVVDNLRGFTEWGPIPFILISPFIAERKVYWQDMHDRQVERLKKYDHTVTRFDLPVYARGVVGDKAAPKSASSEQTAGSTPEPVAKGGAEPPILEAGKP